MKKLKFASREWLKRAEMHLKELVAAGGVEGEIFSLCEIYTSAPQDCVGFEGNASAWHFQADGKTVTVGEGRLAEALVTVEVDYDAILPVARTLNQDLESSGHSMPDMRVEKKVEDTPEYLSTLHDLLAVVTK